MSSSDGERIAPVTYLFGATAPEVSSASIPPSEELPLAEVPADRPRQSKPRAQGDGRFERVSNVSMYALARRGMSSQEMRDYLIAREFDVIEVDAEIDRLERVALLDDAALAETLVRTLRERKGLGRSAVVAELRRRRIESSAIEVAIGDVADDEVNRATEIAVKRAPQLRGLDSATAKRRLGAFLMRKGYSGSSVSAAVAAALEPTGPTFR